MTSNRVSDSFYVRMGFVLLILLFAGFVPFIMMRFETDGTMSSLFIVHGLLSLMWFILYTYQASLIPGKNVKRHIFLGKSSIILAIAMVITALMVTQNSFDRGSHSATPFSPEHFLILPMIDVVSFTIFYSLAFLNRKKADTHKHFMLITGILIMDPAIARLALTIGFMPIGLLIHFGLIGALILYDRKKDGSIHFATKLGLAFLVLRYGLVFLVGPTESWAKFVHMIFG